MVIDNGRFMYPVNFSVTHELISMCSLLLLYKIFLVLQLCQIVTTHTFTIFVLKCFPGMAQSFQITRSLKVFYRVAK